MAFKPFLAALLLMLVAGASVRAETPRIVGFGDSLMSGYGVGPGEGFTEQLEAALKAAGINADVVNAGVSGDTTSGGLSRLDWSVPDDADLVILELGANDMLRGIGPDVTERNLDAMLARLRERGIPVLLAGMRAAPNLGRDFQERFDALYPRLAARYGQPLYPFFLEGVAAEPRFLQQDGMHPNAEGVAVIVRNILPFVMKALGRSQDAARP